MSVAKIFEKTIKKEKISTSFFLKFKPIKKLFIIINNKKDLKITNNLNEKTFS